MRLSNASASQEFNIGKVPITGEIVSAPMDGITDSPYRIIARKFGAAMTFTEFINAQDVVQNNPNLMERLKFTNRERPIAFQVFDNNTERLRDAAVALRNKYDFDILDVNFGCANNRVTARGAGAALLKSPQTVAAMIATLVKHLDVPITAKIRLGWDSEDKNYLLISRIIEDNGAKCVSVHARTRQQRLSGKPDWHAISEIKDHVNIPVIGNGDVNSPDDIRKIKVITNCDGVMIGRASIGNPWIFSRFDKNMVNAKDVKNTVIEHLLLSVAHYGQDKGIRVFRKHASKYLGLLECPLGEKKQILTSLDLNFITQTIKSL